MEAKFQIFILLLFYFGLQNAILCMKKLLSSKAEKLTELTEEMDNQALARLIYKDYGTNDSHLCRSIDGKTTRITAYSICKQAAEKLYPRRKMIIKESDVSCLYVEVSTDYEHAEKYCRSKRHKMAKCRENYELKRGRDCFYFYLIHAKDNFYYVFGEKKVGRSSIIAVLELNPPQFSDYPAVKPIESRDGRMADFIFGYYGISEETKSYKNEGHVCYRKSKNSAIFGDQVCRLALETLNWKFMFSVKIICQRHKIKRRVDNGCVNFKEKTKSFVNMVNCSYAEGANPLTAMVFNGPEKGLFYVAKQSNLKSDYYVITHLLDLRKKLM